MWLFRIATGVFGYHDDSKGTFAKHADAYSGYGVYRNNPAFMNWRDLGPIPVGVYFIGPAHDTRDHGPFVLALTPAPLTDTLGRDGFLMHGDSILRPGQASHGCIVLPRAAREAVNASLDKTLLVETGLAPGNEETKGRA